jgi:hypothetical protein
LILNSPQDNRKAWHKYIGAIIKAAVVILLLAIFCGCEKKDYFDPALAGQYAAFSGECILSEIEIAQDGTFTTGDMDGHILTQEGTASFYSGGQIVFEADYLLDDMYLQIEDDAGNSGCYINSGLFEKSQPLTLSGRYISSNMSALLEFDSAGNGTIYSVSDGSTRQFDYIYSQGLLKVTYTDDKFNEFYFLEQADETLVLKSPVSSNEMVFMLEQSVTLPQGEYSTIYYGREADDICLNANFAEKQVSFQGTEYELLGLENGKAYFLSEGKLYALGYEAHYPNLTISDDNNKLMLTDLSALSWSRFPENMAGVYTSEDLQKVLVINEDGTLNLTMGCVGADFSCEISGNIMKLESGDATLYYDFACDEDGIYIAPLPRLMADFTPDDYLVKLR